jgi:hypothetical protein
MKCNTINEILCHSINVVSADCKETPKPSSFISNSALISVASKQPQSTWITALTGNGTKKK